MRPDCPGGGHDFNSQDEGKGINYVQLHLKYYLHLKTWAEKLGMASQLANLPFSFDCLKLQLLYLALLSRRSHPEANTPPQHWSLRT
ncbi:hypothetical protein D623_10002075 [Myotis brandtii]|uniref:Uncharacterized protein n=1 Tax=Myotis brandtii TaxID=109478 RepID=S7NV87_MYOBR|nr:hypothetical protein D623_10002075 [Myotis brandtii]